MRHVKMNLGPAHLAVLSRRFARGLARIPEPAPVYVIYQHDKHEEPNLVVAYRSRKLAEEAATKMRKDLILWCDDIGIIGITEVPVKG